ncbi:SDR family NAD(P)-dependent oxidoreductase [Paraburkholderia sp.]|uniref:SDR family NAD(P)-dependent oxidoreductase n=1 Tax=Paraburkholderia sp. TaxID=1926495 RepID=UPI003D6F4A84
MSKVWLITGSARGLGRHILDAALAAGHRVVAAARDPGRLADLQAQFGERLRTVELDVTDAAAARAAVQVAIEAFGRLDVLVNNAGYGHIAPLEQVSDDDFRAQIETNFYGVVNLTRAVLPAMRAQRSGHIINISSVGGRIGMAGLAAYQSAKWAVGGFTEVMAREVAPIGIKVVALEPGGMRTDWGTVAGSKIPALLPDYEASVGALLKMFGSYVIPGDPARVAQVVVRIAEHGDPPEHLLLGSDALHFFDQVDAERVRSAEAWRDVSLSTDFDTGPIPAFPDR